MTALQVSSIGKAYRSYRSEWQRIATWFGLPFKPREEHWVLRDVTFDLQPGEAVGVIGENGAGKSTLLKIITGTLQPTSGVVHIKGRVAAILELGMGFNAELTGRQNARHAAGLMGFSAEQIEAAMPGIEAFAEIGDYFDQPVRTYSSGMQMRVAFAVATAYRPEILIVDEALSVGDAYFQHKSFARIREFSQAGTSLLIVSHDKVAIQSICDRCVLIDHGHVIAMDVPEKIFDLYNARLGRHQDSVIEETRAADGGHATASGTREATIEKIELLSEEGESQEVVPVGHPIQIRIKVQVHQNIDSLVLGYGIKDRLGQVMFGTNTFFTGQIETSLKAGERLTYTIHSKANLGVGSYSINAALVKNKDHIEKNYHWIDRGLIFEVINQNKPEFIGCSWNDVRFSIQRAG